MGESITAKLARENHVLRAANARLEAENEKLWEALEKLEDEVLNKIDGWANAYPEDIFIELEPEQWIEVRQVLDKNNYELTAITGSAARHCVRGIQEYAKRGLEIAAALESEDK